MRPAMSRADICSSRSGSPVRRRQCLGPCPPPRPRKPPQSQQHPATAPARRTTCRDPRLEALETLTAAEADTLEAIVARLIPTDENGPGATEARAAHYIDRALTGPLRGSRASYAANLAALDAYAQATKGAPFAKLPAIGAGRGAHRHGEERRHRLYSRTPRRSSRWCARTPSRARSAIPITAATPTSSAGT